MNETKTRRGLDFSWLRRLGSLTALVLWPIVPPPGHCRRGAPSLHALSQQPEGVTLR